MMRSTSKFLVILCVLLASRGISTQQLDDSGSYNHEFTTEGILGISALPSIVKTTQGINGNSDSKVSSGIHPKIVTDGPEAAHVTEIPIVEEAVTDTYDYLDGDLQQGTTILPDNENNDADGATEEVDEPSETTTTNEDLTTVTTPTCTTAGTFPNPTDCHAYFTCSATVAGNLERVDLECPHKMAFNVEHNRCTRDISACTDDGIVCKRAGVFADPLKNTSYYSCILRRALRSYRKYHIDCGPGTVFVPQLRKCYIDINNLQNFTPNYGPDDEDIVKAELKQFKAEEKRKRKQQKLRNKMERKAQKEKAKQEAKEAKEQAKALDISEEED